MTTLNFLIDIYPIYTMFHTRLYERVGSRLNRRVSIDMVVDDFFDICLHLASDAVQHVEVEEQKMLLNPMGRVRQMVSTQIQDIYFDHFSEYVCETDYFGNYDADSIFVANDVASLGVYVIDEILREIMSTLIQFPVGFDYFNTESSVDSNDYISEVLFTRPNQLTHDLQISVGFQ